MSDKDFDLLLRKPRFPFTNMPVKMKGGSQKYRPGVNRDFLGVNYLGYGGYSGHGQMRGGHYNTPLHAPRYGDRKGVAGKRGVIRI